MEEELSQGEKLLRLLPDIEEFKKTLTLQQLRAISEVSYTLSECGLDESYAGIEGIILHYLVAKFAMEATEKEIDNIRM